MYKIIFILFSFQLFGVSYSQSIDKAVSAKSNAEKFSEKDGSLIFKKWAKIGAVGDCQIDLMNYIDYLKYDSMIALKISKTVFKSYGTINISTLIDADEIPSILKAIKIIENEIISQDPSRDMECNYYTRSGFGCGVFVSKGSWKFYFKLDKNDKDSYSFLDLSEMELFKSYLEHIQTSISKRQ